MSLTRPRAFVPLLAALALGLGGCGTDDSSSVASDDTPAATSSSSSPAPTPPSSTSAAAAPSDTPPPGTPDCAAVWRDGAKIPRAYRGCVDADGAYVAKDGLGCSSGQTIIRFADRFYGVAGGTVHEATRPLLSDRDYRAAVVRCRA